MSIAKLNRLQNKIRNNKKKLLQIWEQKLLTSPEFSKQ